MSKRNKSEVIGKGKACPKCKELMQRRKHRQGQFSHLKQPFYFKEWDYCYNCKHLQHYEEFKVWNKNEMSEFLKFKEKEKEQMSFLNSC